MRYTTMAILAGLLLTSALPAAEQPKAEKSSAPAEQLQELEQEIRKTRMKFYQEYVKAKSDKERQELRDENKKRMHAYAHRALELARKHAKEPVAVEALCCIITDVAYQGAGDEIETAFDLLRTDYITSDKLQRVCGMASLYDRVSAKPEPFLRAVLAKNPHREIRGYACYNLGLALQRQASWAKQLRNPERAKPWGQGLPREVVEHLKASDPDKLLQEAEKRFEQTIAEYGDVEKNPIRGTLGDVAKAALFEMRYLVIGKVAPEIEGEDLDGKPLKLSDYRGKVVVLNFWGNWCPHCRAMYPHERSLVKRLEDKPFALLGINSDSDKEKLKDVLKKEEITWRSWWDGGGTGNPIARKWNVMGWPTVYVLDAKGVIRYRDVRGKELDEAVDALLKEMVSGSDNKAANKNGE